nr:MAG TPA: hypothetical protein [Caudoviricetes sp.]
MFSIIMLILLIAILCVLINEIYRFFKECGK